MGYLLVPPTRWRSENPALRRVISHSRRSTHQEVQASRHFQNIETCAGNQLRLILPAGTAMGVRLRHASREVQDLGGRLSNTRTTCPRVGDTLGKLRIIPHRSGMLERFRAKSSGARGWVCGLSACRGFNRPPRHRRVRAMGVVARRWTLRHESRPYGAQQSRKLRNVGNHDGGTPSAYTLCTLFSCLKSRRSKGWVRRVPAAAVIPAARVVLIIIESKTSVAGLVDAWVNRGA